MLSENWEWTMRCNQPRGWRQRVASFLVRIAERIDGRWYQVTEVETVPRLDPREIARALRLGQLHAQRLIAESAQQAACEKLMRMNRPELFEEGRP